MNPIVKNMLEEKIKEKVIQQAKLQIATFFQLSMAKGLKDKFKYVIGKKALMRGETMVETDSEEVESDADFDTSNDDGSEEKRPSSRQPSAKLQKIR